MTFVDVLRIFKRRWLWFGGAFGTVLAGTIVATLMQTPIFEAKGQILIQSDGAASELLGLAGQLSALTSASGDSNPIETEIQILLSPPMLEKMIEKFELKNDEGKPIELKDFVKKFIANPVQGTDVINVMYQDADPELASQIVNSLMQLYIRENIEMTRSQSQSVREFITRQLPRAKGELEQAQRELSNFKQQNQLIEPEEEATVSIKELAELKSNIISTRAEFLDSQERTNQLRAKLGGISSEEAISSNSVARSAPLQANIEALNTAQDELALAQKIYQEDHPTLKNLKEQVDSMEQNLNARLSEATDIPQNSQTLGSEVMADLVRSENTTEGLSQRLSSLQRAYQSEAAKTTNYPELQKRLAN
ncbi:MAG: hypothetical protein HC810_02530 [Acaryochloridaceae cyanobacterium RL_2_7]|nr:hypothetical protein [Acaryochloridaceae cyanobacterium RL_2_7]